MMHAAGYMAEKAEDESTALYNDYMQSVSTTPSGTSSQALSPAQYQQIQNELARQKAKVIQKPFTLLCSRRNYYIFRQRLSFCTFSFGHCVVCSSSIYGFRIPLWYLQALLINDK